MDLGLTQLAATPLLRVDDTSLRHWEEGVYEPQVAQRPAIERSPGYRPPGPASRNLGERLRQVREARGFRRKALARVLILDPWTLARIEHGSPARPTARVTRIVLGWLERVQEPDSGIR